MFFKHDRSCFYMLLSCSCSCYHYSKFLLPLSTEAFSQHWSFFLSTTQHGTPTQHTHMTHPHDTPTWHTHTTHPHNTASWHSLTTHPHDSPAWHYRTAHPQDTPKWHNLTTHLFVQNWRFLKIWLKLMIFLNSSNVIFCLNWLFSNFSPGLIKINSCSTDMAV